MASSTPLDSKILRLTLTLSNYPILSKKIRANMRQELFVRGIIDPDVLEDEVEKKAVATQHMEGIIDPLSQEMEEMWEERMARVRDYLTDFYFAYNLPFSRFEEILENAVTANQAGHIKQSSEPFINPELAPWYVLFDLAEKYANYPPDLYAGIKHHLRQIIVVLLKSLISDQLAFVRIAREFIDIFDMKAIKNRKIGRGKIGGKAAGMILAHKILTHPDETDTFDLKEQVTTPVTYFIGGDIYYTFKSINKLEYTHSYKYRPHEEIAQQYPRIREDYLSGRFPDEITEKLQELLIQVGNSPLIVRSSSLLEDNFGSAFAGKYDSFFLPNQGTLEENLLALQKAITQVYASVLNPDALFYRKTQKLEDYDERMAVLIQKVQGERHGRYFLPFIAGVGFSRNPFLWNKRLRPEDGFLRIVCGLGTRAVDRVDKDYPRMIGLSHPQLRPVSSAADIIKYSQRMIDVIDLENNCLTTVPLTDILSTEFPGVQYLASVDEGNFVKPIFSLGSSVPPEKLVLTFDNLLKNTDFVKLMKSILQKLERHYERPVDIEFTVQLIPKYPKPDFKIFLLQCRPLSNREWHPNVIVPLNIPSEDRIFQAHHLVPQGIVERIRYIIYVDPLRYIQIPDNIIRFELARVVGRLNKKLENEIFICIGPGRWGSSNVDLGVKVSYADIYNTRMLIEVGVSHNGITPEASYGTHFFQDLVESNIYPLALFPDETEDILHWTFMNQAPNCLTALSPRDEPYAEYIKVIDIPAISQGKLLRVALNAEESKGLGYLSKYPLS